LTAAGRTQGCALHPDLEPAGAAAAGGWQHLHGRRCTASVAWRCAKDQPPAVRGRCGWQRLQRLRCCRRLAPPWHSGQGWRSLRQSLRRRTKASPQQAVRLFSWPFRHAKFSAEWFQRLERLPRRLPGCGARRGPAPGPLRPAADAFQSSKAPQMCGLPNSSRRRHAWGRARPYLAPLPGACFRWHALSPLLAHLALGSRLSGPARTQVLSRQQLRVASTTGHFGGEQPRPQPRSSSPQLARSPKSWRGVSQRCRARLQLTRRIGLARCSASAPLGIRHISPLANRAPARRAAGSPGPGYSCECQRPGGRERVAVEPDGAARQLQHHIQRVQGAGCAVVQRRQHIRIALSPAEQVVRAPPGAPGVCACTIYACWCLAARAAACAVSPVPDTRAGTTSSSQGRNWCSRACRICNFWRHISLSAMRW